MSSFSSNRIRLAGSFALALAAVNTAAAQTAPLSAAESDPRVLGWMQGFPPPAERLITQPDSNYFSFPKLRWTVCHLREFLPTEQVSRGLGAPVPLEYDLDETAIDALTFKPLGSDGEMTWKESLSANYTDGMLILHKGKIVYERYFGCLGETGKHGAMSMTKSLTGLLAELESSLRSAADGDIPAAIAPILATERAVSDGEKNRTAVFYSISNCQRGLAGVSFGNFLIKQVVDELSKEFPSLTTFVTLSRKLSARAASTGGRDHTSHRLVAMGFSERQAVVILYALAAAAGAERQGRRQGDGRQNSEFSVHKTTSFKPINFGLFMTNI